MQNNNALNTAWIKVLGNGGGAGGDGVSLATYQRRLNQNLSRLSNKLKSETFHSSPYQHYDIPKDNGKLRRLSIPSVEDRIVHTAIAQYLSPILEPQFEDCSFAYRPGRSIKQAVTAIERWRDEGYIHVVDADITNYFASIDHELLIATLQKHLRQHNDVEFIISLVAEVVDHQGIELETLGKGLAQGSPLSPILANLYLDYLDEKIEAKGFKIVRFADDFIILCKSLKSIQNAYEELQEILAELELELNAEKTRLIDFDRGFEFIGYLFVRSLAMQKKKQPESSQADSEIKNSTNPTLNEDTLLDTTKGRTDYAKGDRILYVLERGRKIDVRQRNFDIRTKEGNLVLQVNVDRVDRLEVGPGVTIEQKVFDLCLTQDTQLIILNGWGEQQGRLITNEDDRAALQFSQAQACGCVATATKLSNMVVDARIRNQRTQLFRLNRRQENPDVERILKNMGRNLRKLAHIKTLEQIRGIEGASAALYWPALGLLCKEAQTPFRRTRPAQDAINASINYLTYMLERDIRSSMRSAGLHVGFGFLHKPNDYSQAGVYDLMEPFRAALTEGLVMFLFNSKRLKLDMFSTSMNGSIWMNKSARRAIITSYEQAVAKRINIPNKSKKLSWRRMMWYQSNSLAKAYKANDTSLFVPYLMEV